MSSVTASNSKENVTAATEKAPKQKHTSVKTAVNNRNENTTNLPDDIVNFSAVIKNPAPRNNSTAVTSEEKSALMSFSIFS